MVARFTEHSEVRADPQLPGIARDPVGERISMYAGRGGVEAYPSCYRGRHEHCGWQMIGGSGDVPPSSFADIQVIPTVAEHFDPRSLYMFGIDPNNPGTNLRFTVAAITTGGRPQYANNDSIPDGTGGELLSDVFNRSDQPLMVYNWSLISTDALGSPLIFSVFNLNAQPLRVFIGMFGTAMNDTFVQKWKKATDEGKGLYVVRTGPLDSPADFIAIAKKELPESYLEKLRKDEGNGKMPRLKSAKKKKGKRSVLGALR